MIPETAPVCARCVAPLGDQFITVHRRNRNDPRPEAVAVCHDCATPAERRAQAERKEKGMGW